LHLKSATPHAHARRIVTAAVCGLYEKELKTLNPQVRNITYDIADLYTYLDQLQDLSCLVYALQPPDACCTPC